MPDIVCISPVDGREVARRRPAEPEAIEAALGRARAAQAAWAEVALDERLAAMRRFLDAVRAQNEAAVPELAWQMGRPVRYGGELRSLEDRVEGLLALAPEALAPYVPPEKAGFRRLVKRTPVGVVLAIAPWNYPYLTAVNSVLPALLAGNAVLLKHAAQTVLVGERFQAAMDAAGLPAGLFQHLVLDHEATAKLLAAGAVDHVSFTGSVAGGRAVERAAAGTFTGVGLELGGKDPAYVRPDADLEGAVANLVDGSFYNSGQCCCGIERIYVHAALYDRFVDAFVAATSDYVLGDPLDAGTTLGPMAARRFADHVRHQTDEAVARGARALIDPRRFPADAAGTPYLMPQVLTGVDHAMRVMREESFGPVAGIMPVDSDEEAVRLMNDSDYGLTASIWTSDLDAAERLGDRLLTGTVMMNRCDYVDPGLAWTGVKDTGRGAGLSVMGFHALTRPRSYHLRHAS